VTATVLLASVGMLNIYSKATDNTTTALPSPHLFEAVYFPTLPSSHPAMSFTLILVVTPMYVVRQLSSRTRHRVRAVAALDKSLSMV